MDQGEVTLQHHGLPPALRTLQPATLQALHQPQDAQLHHHALQSLAPNLQGLDAADPSTLFHQQRFHHELSDAPHPHALQGPNPFNHGALPHLHHPQQNLAPQGYPQHQDDGCQFGILTAQQSHLGGVGNTPRPQPSHVPHLSQDNEFAPIPDQGDTIFKSDGQFEGLKIIPHPPDLHVWRERLFNVDDTIVLTEDQWVLQARITQAVILIASVYIDSKPTFLILTMSTHIAQLRNTSASLSYHITGTVV